jgi:RND family efflux transporter MFP subunit
MVLLPLVVLGIGAFVTIQMIEARVEPETKPLDTPPLLVRVIDVKPESVALKVRAEGTVAPRVESQLVPEVTGRVVEVSRSLAVGGFFEEGEVLLKIETRAYDLMIIRAESAIAQAKLRLATEHQEADVALKEWQTLGQGEPAPLVAREPQIAEAQAALASAEAALQQAKFDLERTVVRAPYSGRIRSKQVDVGQFVQRGAPVATLYSVDVAEVKLPIADAELEFVNLPLAYRDAAESANGPGVTLTAEFAGREHKWYGKIVRTEGEIDPATRMVNAIAQIEDPYGKSSDSRRPPLAVGMFVEAEINGRRVGNIVRLPRTALRGDAQVLVVDSTDHLYYRDIDIFRLDRDEVLVRGGLEPGDRVCVSNVEAAVNGMRVRVEENAVTDDGGQS